MKRQFRRLAAGLLAAAVLLPVFSENTAAASADDYAAQLAAAGFPESYIEPLTALHAQYPQWQFEAVDTGLDWETVLDNESENGVNLVQKSADDSKKSTADGAYDWMTDTWTVYDGSSWVAANRDYIAYYMDPRNFLNETDIFQFESLSYSKVQTLEGVTSILKGSFMEKSVKDTDGTTLDYAQAFMDIGEQVGASPYHLASRVRQEQGEKGTSSLISGTYSGYEGYFNYFNVGASGVTSALVIKNGLAYAKKAGWNTRYAALLGGAQILADKYIGVGQDTLYFQKFNVVNAKTLYRHQYMANLAAAYSEGKKLGQGYTDKQQAFVFRIPVYENMPETAAAFTASGNPNNYLKSLTVKGQSLTPTFSGATKTYSLIVEDVSSIKISASAVSSKATVTGTGTKTLSDGTNTFKIKCKSQSGVTRTYKLTVVKKETQKASVSSKTYRLGDGIVDGITPGTDAAAFCKNLTVTNASVKLVGTDGKEVSGTVGTGTVLEVYDTNKKKQASYTVVIYGDVNGDGVADAQDLALLNRHLTGKETLTGSFLTAADTNRKGDGADVLDLIYLSRHISGTLVIAQ